MEWYEVVRPWVYIFCFGIFGSSVVTCIYDKVKDYKNNK
jgi:hypothetical protein